MILCVFATPSQAQTQSVRSRDEEFKLKLQKILGTNESLDPAKVHQDCIPTTNPITPSTQTSGTENKTETETETEAETKETPPLQSQTDDQLSDVYLNENGCWAERRSLSDKCTHPSWDELTQLERSQHIYDGYEVLLKEHKLGYSPRILLCKTIRESCLRPQDMSPAAASSAAGLSQVTRSTASDLFVRGTWFKPKVVGFTNIEDGRQYHDKMKQSILAQMELGLAVLHQKGIDFNSKNIKVLLSNYYGTSSQKENSAYANAIYDCADCLAKTKSGELTEACLKIARPSCF
jgi:hypothetical protein